jgi:predicted NAD/FAD-binding protein
LQVNDRPKWQTVQGCGRAYVRKIAATLPDYRLNSPVHAVKRTSDGVIVTGVSEEKGFEEVFDAVVFATHAPQTLHMLADASSAEKGILSGVRYQPNTAVLHTDVRQMPQRRKVWSAWNYLGGPEVNAQRPVCVSYLLNQLQDLPFSTPVILTLNPYSQPDPSTVIAQFEYEHPLFDHAAIAAQQKLPSIQGKNRAWFAGAWTGYGFHEDGLKSALRVAADFGVAPSWAKV